MTQDKVDFVLPPWSTGFNLAAAPVYARNGYPQLAVTANSNDAENLVKQMPTLFFFLNEPRNFGGALVEVLGKLKGEGKINNKIVMLSVGDQFGAEASSGVSPVLKNAGFDLVISKSYPLGASDLTNEIKEAKASGADTFIAYSYPPDTFMLTGTSITQAYNPKIFYTAVGTAFAAYGANFKDKAQGVLGIGGWDPTLPGAQEYVQRQKALLGRDADGWAAPVTYASLRCWSRRSRRPVPSIARRCSTPSSTTAPGRPSSGRSISRATSAASNGASASGRAASTSASRRPTCRAPSRSSSRSRRGDANGHVRVGWVSTQPTNTNSTHVPD